VPFSFAKEVISILSQETIQSAKSVDLLSYLQRYEPDELVHVAGNEYATKSHGSLKISNGKWHWFSRGIGGTTALDYLIHVKDMRFTEAVLHLVGNRYQEQVVPKQRAPVQSEKHARNTVFSLPPAHENANRVFAYLTKRGIAKQILSYCLKNKLIYEDAIYHNAVFVGLDAARSPRHAMLRGTLSGSTFRQDAPHSDKRFTFNLPARSQSDTLYVFESAIDLLSRATLEWRSGKDWLQDHQLSLGGLAPLALNQYLKDHPEILTVVLCLDRDEPGLEAAPQFRERLQAEGYTVRNEPVPEGKDYNNYLCALIAQSDHVQRDHHMYPFNQDNTR
jgi:hypothetical protein